MYHWNRTDLDRVDFKQDRLRQDRQMTGNMIFDDIFDFAGSAVTGNSV